MNDAPKDPVSQSPVSVEAIVTDAELAAATRKAVQAAPDQNTQARLDRRVAEALKDAKRHCSANDPPLGL